MNNGSKPRMREICALVEQMGNPSSGEVDNAAPHLSSKAVKIYLARAWQLGMLHRTRDTKGTGRSYRYRATPGWQEIGDEPPVPTAAEMGIYPNGPMPIASVWDLGSRVPATLAGVWA